MLEDACQLWLPPIEVNQDILTYGTAEDIDVHMAKFHHTLIGSLR
jgi:hypothetical protein